MRILDKIKLPEDLKSLDIKDLDILSSDLREFITEYTLKNGGHLSSNLGVVDLTCALSYVFDFPSDKLIFDVGHQCYAYKILSGRMDGFKQLRQKDGLSGFPKREESRYDCANSGHASTALSIACGMARGGEKGNIICLIGDGAMTGGLFYEAMNDVLTLDKKVIIIVNDNDMSISDNVGFVNEYLKIVRKCGETPAINIETIGNINGHDIAELIEKLEYAKKSKKSVILHVVTQKGKGIADAEANPTKFHSVGKTCENLSFGQVFGGELVKLAQKNKDIYAITAAMTDGTGLSEFAQKLPERFVDVGIAEGHAVTMSAGLALAGRKPYVAIYSTFLQRAYDNILHDVCLNNLPVVFCIDRAGFVGGDGETHQGLYDVAYLSSMPNMTIAAPKDGEELKCMLKWSAEYDSPLAIRYPKSQAPLIYSKTEKIQLGKWEKLSFSDSKTVLISNGEVLANVVKAADELNNRGIKADVVNARFIKPIDCELLDSIADGKKIFVFEEYTQTGSVYSKILDYFNEKGCSSKVFSVNVADVPYAVASREQLLEQADLHVDGIVNFVQSKMR